MNLKELVLKKFKKNKELSQSFIWRLIQVLGKQGTSAVMFFIATLFLSKEDMGVYNYVFSVLALLVIFSDFGISTATSKYVTEYNTVNKEKLNKVLFNSGLIIVLIAIIVTAVTLIWGEALFPKYYEYILIALPLVLVSPMSSLLDGIYRGLKRFKILSLISLINGLVAILISYIFVTNYGLEGAILSQSVFFLTYTLVLIFLQKGYVFKIDKKILKDIGMYSLSFGIATLGFYLFSRVNILILGQYDLLEEIAVYELLNKMYTVYLIPSTVLGQVLAPTIVEMFSLKKYTFVQTTFRKLLLYLSLTAIVFIPISMVVTKLLIGAVLPDYSNGIMMALLFPVAITYAKMIPGSTINSGLITSTGHAGIMAIQNVISGILNVTLNLIVIKEYGYIGVVWVTFWIQLISLIALYLVYYLKLKKYTDEK